MLKMPLTIRRHASGIVSVSMAPTGAPTHRRSTDPAANLTYSRHARVPVNAPMGNLYYDSGVDVCPATDGVTGELNIFFVGKLGWRTAPFRSSWGADMSQTNGVR